MADVTETFPDGTVIERDFTADEVAQREKDAADSKAAEKAAKKAATDRAVKRAALLERLGITEDEAVLLLGG